MREMIGDIKQSQEIQHPNNRSQKEREIREERRKKREEERRRGGRIGGEGIGGERRGREGKKGDKR